MHKFHLPNHQKLLSLSSSSSSSSYNSSPDSSSYDSPSCSESSSTLSRSWWFDSLLLPFEPSRFLFLVNVRSSSGSSSPSSNSSYALKFSICWFWNSIRIFYIAFLAFLSFSYSILLNSSNSFYK